MCAEHGHFFAEELLKTNLVAAIGDKLEDEAICIFVGHQILLKIKLGYPATKDWIDALKAFEQGNYDPLLILTRNEHPHIEQLLLDRQTRQGQRV